MSSDPHNLDEMTPIKRHGSSVTLPAWAWRVHTITLILLASALIAILVAICHKGIGILVSMEGRLSSIESQRTNAILDHESRLTKLEGQTEWIVGQVQNMRNTLNGIDRKLDVIESRMK